MGRPRGGSIIKKFRKFHASPCLGEALNRGTLPNRIIFRKNILVYRPAAIIVGNNERLP
jgi:hypothetical protein